MKAAIMGAGAMGTVLGCLFFTRKRVPRLDSKSTPIRPRWMHFNEKGAALLAVQS